MVQAIKIYVGNVPGSARNSELKELFEKFGKVVECDILKEFAFVHMDDTNDAKAAIAGLNDSLWKGSRIRVELSTTKTNKGEPSLKYKGSGDLSRGLRRRSSDDRHGRDDRRSPGRNGHSSSSRSSRDPKYDSRYSSSMASYSSRSNGFSRSNAPSGSMRDVRYNDLPTINGRPYPTERSSRAPYPDVYDQRGSSRGYPMSSSSSRSGAPPPPSSSRGYPPEYPFHPASYRNADLMRDGYRGDMPNGAGPGAYHPDPYMRPPMGAMHLNYFRGPPPGRYDYEPAHYSQSSRQSRYTPPPMSASGRDAYRHMSPPPRHNGSSRHAASPPPMPLQSSSSGGRYSSPPPPPGNMRHTAKRHHHNSSPSRSRSPSKPKHKTRNGGSRKSSKKQADHSGSSSANNSKHKASNASMSSQSSQSSRSSRNSSPNESPRRSRKHAHDTSANSGGSMSPPPPSRIQASSVAKVVSKKASAHKRGHSSSVSRSRSRSSTR